jgi:Ras-related protein Rab-1A
MMSAYYRNVDGIILMYDASNSASFDSLEYWSSAFEPYRRDTSSISILGNKVDGADSQVPRKEHLAFTRTLLAKHAEFDVRDH